MHVRHGTDHAMVIRSRAALIGSWALSRALLLAFLTGVVAYPDGPSVMADVRLYAEWSELLATGRFPVGDDMWQYPPGAGVVFALAALVGSNPMASFIALVLVADLAILVILMAAGSRRGGPGAAWLWVGSALVIGPVFLARFDVFPTVAAVVALVLIARPVASGAAAAIGALLKVWPAFMLIALPRRALPKGILAFVLVAAAGLVGVMVWASGSVSFIGEQRDRGLQVESVGALPYVVLGAFGEPMVTQFRFGSMEVDMPGASVAGLVIALGGFVVLGGLALLRILGRLESAAPADVALAAVLVSIATSRVISPQYAVWVAGVAAVTLLDPRTRMRPVLWLLGIWALAGQYIYPFGYGGMLSGEWASVAMEALRTLALVAATVWSVAAVIRAGWSPPVDLASGDVATDEPQRGHKAGVG